MFSRAIGLIDDGLFRLSDIGIALGVSLLENVVHVDPVVAIGYSEGIGKAWTR